MNSPTVEKGTMTVECAAKRLGIGRQLAYELAREGRLPGALRLGHRIVVSCRLLDKFLAGELNNAPAPEHDGAESRG